MARRIAALAALSLALASGLALAAEDPLAGLGDAIAAELAAHWTAPKRKLCVVPFDVSSLKGPDDAAGKRVAERLVAGLKAKGFDAERRDDAASVIAEATGNGQRSKGAKAAKKPSLVLVYGSVTLAGEVRYHATAVLPDSGEILAEVAGLSSSPDGGR